MPPVGFEPTISAGKRPQTYAFDRSATGTGKHMVNTGLNSDKLFFVQLYSDVLKISRTVLTSDHF